MAQYIRILMAILMVVFTISFVRLVKHVGDMSEHARDISDSLVNIEGFVGEYE